MLIPILPNKATFPLASKSVIAAVVPIPMLLVTIRLSDTSKSKNVETPEELIMLVLVIRDGKVILPAVRFPTTVTLLPK